MAIVTKEIKKLIKNIVKAKAALADARWELDKARKACKHKNKEKWTNNDGYGQFIVERCNDCGAQEDGGL